MKLSPTTFEYLKPTEEQTRIMADVRAAYRECAEKVTALLPDGADTTHAIRQLRDSAMWANIACTRNADGSALTDAEASKK